MAGGTYQIVVTGRLLAGAELSQVKEKAARLFNAPAAKLAPLFSGQRVVVKKGLDETSARRYVAAVLETGLECVAEPWAAASQPPPVPGPAAPVSLAPPGVTLIEPSVIAPPDIDTSALSVAAAGGNLIEFTPPPAPEIDISRLSAAPPGEDLINAPETPPPEIDVSRYSLSMPGELLAAAVEIEALEIDVSHLDMAPPRSDVGERRRTDFPPPPDTSHLKLE